MHGYAPSMLRTYNTIEGDSKVTGVVQLADFVWRISQTSFATTQKLNDNYMQ